MMMKRHYKIIAPFEFVVNKIIMISPWFERRDYMSTLTSHTSSGLYLVPSKQPLHTERSQDLTHIEVNVAWSMRGNRSAASNNLNK